MKKLLLVLVAVAMLLPSCKKIEKSIDALENRIDKLEQSIPTIEEQISSIQTSIKALKEVDESLDESIKKLEANDEATAEEIAALQDADAAIEAKIEELKKYVDDAINSTKDWVSATFATLEQLNALSSEVTALKSLVDANKAEAAANLATAIANLETSLKAWVGEQLSNYYTIAQIDAKIVNLEKAIADGDKALQQQLNDLKTQLESAKKELTEAYKKAIEEAITENNGVINTKIANEIAAVNKRIDEEVAAINAKIATMQAQVDKNTEDIAKLLARIQSVSYIPEYADGKVVVTRMGSTSWGELSFRISPKDAVVELEKIWQSALSCEAYYPKTRAVSLVKLAVTEYVADAESGVITVKISGEGLSDEFFAGTQEAKVALVISDGNNSVTSEYVPMIADGIHHIYAKVIIGEDTRATYGEGLVATWEEDDQIALLQEHANYGKTFSIVNKLNIKEGLGTNTASFDGYILVNTSAPRVYHIAYPTSAVSFLTSSTPSLEGSISYKNSSPTSGYQLKAHGTYNYIYNSTLNITIPTTQNGKWEPYMYASTSEAVNSDAIDAKVLTTLNGAIAIRAFEPDGVTPKQLKQITITSSNADIAGVFSGTAQSVGSLGEVVGDETAWHTSFEEASAQSKALASLESKVKTMSPAITIVTKAMSLSFVGGEKEVTATNLGTIAKDAEGCYTYHLNVAPFEGADLTITVIAADDSKYVKTIPAQSLAAVHRRGYVFVWEYE